MSQGDSGRGFVHSLEPCQQSNYEDDGPSEHDMPYLVNLQEIDKSSSADSVSNPYQVETGYSSAASQDSPNLYSASSQEVTDLMDLEHETIMPYQTVVIPDDQLDPPTPPEERAIAISKINLATASLESRRKQSLVHHPMDSPDSSARTDAQKSRTTSLDGLQTLGFSADEASQTIASDLFNKAGCQTKEEMELVIKTTVLSLLSANKSRKTSPPDSPCGEFKDPEKRLECPYCHKKKKTQCDLTYVCCSIFICLRVKLVRYVCHTNVQQ